MSARMSNRASHTSAALGIALMAVLPGTQSFAATAAPDPASTAASDTESAPVSLVPSTPEIFSPPPPARAPAPTYSPSGTPARVSPSTPSSVSGSGSAPATGPAAASASDEDIRDIRGPKSIFPLWLVMAWIAAGILVAIAGLALWRRLQRPPPPRRLELFEIALQRLEDIRSLMHPSTVREFSIAVSDIVRQYIEAQFLRHRHPSHHGGVPARPAGILERGARRASRLAGRVPQSMRPGQIRRRVPVPADTGVPARQRAQLRDRILQTAPRVARARRTAGSAPGRLVIRFLQPEWLWLLALLPLVMLLRGRRGPVAAVEFSDVGLAREVARGSRTRAGGWLWLFPLLAGALMIVGLARPQLSHSSTDGHRQRHRHRARTGCVRLHAGARLSAIDGQRVNRIEVVKSVVSKFIEERPNDRIGLIAFAAAPYLVSPLTLDHDWLQQNLERVSTGCRSTTAPPSVRRSPPASTACAPPTQNPRSSFCSPTA